MQRVSTLEEAMTLVPTHWLLVPNVDRWREGDEMLEIGNIGQGREVFWDLVRPENFGKVVGERDARRPIPQKVRQRVANLMLIMAQCNIPLDDSSAFPLEAWVLA